MLDLLLLALVIAIPIGAYTFYEWRVAMRKFRKG